MAEVCVRGGPGASCREGSPDESAGVQLLTDLEALFRERGWSPGSNGAPLRVATADILLELRALEDRPWPEWKDGKPLTARQLATLLKRYGIKSSRNALLIDGKQVRGYEVGAPFEDAFRRYANRLQPSSDDSEPSTRQAFYQQSTYGEPTEIPLTDCPSTPAALDGSDLSTPQCRQQPNPHGRNTVDGLTAKAAREEGA